MNNMQHPIDLPLRDIHLPDPISWWPLPIGWWLVIVGCLLLIFAMVVFIRRWIRPTLKKEAIRTLDAIETAFKNSSNASKCVADISILLRRIVITRDPKNAGLTGKAWLELLDQPNEKDFSQGIGQVLLTAPYQPQMNEADVVDLMNLCRKVVNRL